MSHTAVYNTQRWRQLPRDHCTVSVLLGEAAGACGGMVHHHHVDPQDPASRTVQVCARHHPKVHALLRHFSAEEWRRCPHRHTSKQAREACERRLNRAA